MQVSRTGSIRDAVFLAHNLDSAGPDFPVDITSNDKWGREPAPGEPITHSAEAVHEDLAFLYETLQVSSYDLFLNTTPFTQEDEILDAALQLINKG
jgi:hypothetical protein